MRRMERRKRRHEKDILDKGGLEGSSSDIANLRDPVN